MTYKERHRKDKTLKGERTIPMKKAKSKAVAKKGGKGKKYDAAKYTKLHAKYFGLAKREDMGKV